LLKDSLWAPGWDLDCRSVNIQLIIDVWNEEHGNRRRAERSVELPAVPRVGEIIDVARMLALGVTAVRWQPPDQRPLVFLGRAEGTSSSVTDEDAPVLTMPETYVDQLREAGWQLSDW
jgi:hypothetical protein